MFKNYKIQSSGKYIVLKHYRKNYMFGCEVSVIPICKKTSFIYKIYTFLKNKK